MSSRGGVVVVGAGRGLGRGVAVAVARSGRDVLALARTESDLTRLAASESRIATLTVDATDEAVARRVVAGRRPEALVLAAGAVPATGALTELDWTDFSRAWDADVRIAFGWLRSALLTPLPPGGRVLVVSSGAAVKGSPASGGYAGAKATQRFMAAYAREEARQAGLDLSVVTVLPAMTPYGAVGRAGIAAYAARSGRSEAVFEAALGPLLTPEQAGAAVVELLGAEPAGLADDYLLTGEGLRPLV